MPKMKSNESIDISYNIPVIDVRRHQQSQASQFLTTILIFRNSMSDTKTELINILIKKTFSKDFENCLTELNAFVRSKEDRY